MKKNASFITMNSTLVRWMSDKIKNDGLNINGADEFCEELDDLLNGEVATLMLAMSNDVKVISETVDDTIYVGDMEIYPKSRKVLRSKEEIMLTPKEFDILYFLARNRGDVFTKEQIYQAVWEDDYLLADSNIMAFIRKLRKKIEYNPDSPAFILTIWGIGYKFNDKL